MLIDALFRSSKSMVRLGKGVLNKTIDVKVQAQKCLNFDVKRFVKYSFSYGIARARSAQNKIVRSILNYARVQCPLIYTFLKKEILQKNNVCLHF